jgi:GNAT superfamily N-acetyltransferase
LSEIPDKHLFMMCRALNPKAPAELPPGFHVRNCRKNELDVWMNFPFDDPAEAERHRGFMAEYFQTVYAPKGDLFFESCLFVCDAQDHPVATCFAWKAYGRITTIHWFKVLKPFEGRGIGRGLLSIVMKGLSDDDYPVFLHTQPSSYRAIKLYTDFGFELLSDPVIGTRPNDLQECLPILQRHMPAAAFQALRITKAPSFFLEAVRSADTVEF